MIHSKEFNCIHKILQVCKNRGTDQLAFDIIKNIGPKYLNQTEIKELSGTPIKKSTIHKDKITFINESQYPGTCEVCKNAIKPKETIFIWGKKVFHVLCGIENIEEAKENYFYQKWLIGNSKIEKEDSNDSFEGF